MRQNTILNIVLTLTIFFCSSKVYGQKTPQELGQLTFNCFQKGNLDSLYKLIPTISEIADFGKAIGIDSSSTQFKEFINGYPQVIKHFKELCNDIINDTTELQFSWTTATLMRIEKSERALPIDNRDPNSKTVLITIVDVFFSSNDKTFKHTLGDANMYSNIWKPGNNLSLVRQ